MIDKHSSTRDIALVVGGMAVGMMASRLLPPLLATARGAKRAAAGEDPFELLIEDHRQIMATLDGMVAAPADATMQRTKLFLALKRKLGKHAMAEEDVVYPLLHDEAEQAEESKHLYEEHARMKIMLFQLEELLMAGQDWSAPANELRELIREHIAEEEETVFPELRQRVAASRMPTVSGQIRREEALIL